jgi:hypothetical protein
MTTYVDNYGKKDHKFTSTIIKEVAKVSIPYQIKTYIQF